MKISTVLFGLGLGMTLAAVLIFLAYERHTFDETRIINAATELGMVWPTSDTAEIIRIASELGMVFP